MKNPYKVLGDTAYIQLHSSLEAAIDAVDLPVIMSTCRSWYAKWDKSAKTYYGYIKHEVYGYILMHRLLLDILDIPTIIPDHINHNGLDNRRSNLRLCNKSLNGSNRSGPSTARSGHRHVYWKKPANGRRGCWMVWLVYNQHRHYAGYFIELPAAVAAAESLRTKIHKQEVNQVAPQAQA